jgi:hypothetical protein
MNEGDGVLTELTASTGTNATTSIHGLALGLCETSEWLWGARGYFGRLQHCCSPTTICGGYFQQRLA